MHPLFAMQTLYATVFYIALLVWGAFEWTGSLFNRVERDAQRRDRGSHWFLLVMISAGIAAAFLCAFYVPGATFPSRQPIVFWIGIALMGTGILFRWYAIRALGRYFTRDVATRPDQEVIERGPYRWIRHPSYSGALITVAGFGLATTNWLALLLVLAFSCIGYAYRLHVEERALCEALGDAYRDYMRRTRRFIPFVW